MQQDLSLSPPDLRPAIVARIRSMKTHADALQYISEVQQKLLLPVRARAAAL
jgi:hypothetical protein